MAGMTKVWNISDDPTTDVEAGVLMVLGRSVAPGRYVRVPIDRLENAHQVHKDVANKLLHIGDQPPAAYLARKKPIRATLPSGIARAHGGTPSKAEKPEVKETVPVEEPTPKPEKDEEAVEIDMGVSPPEPVEDEEEKVEEEAKEDEESVSRGSRRRRR